ncbi:dual specificity protein kinase yak1 [Basidiobolus ranarum]|uniref:Dual specificity protein kinase yak1 n=1 Tax=Basidiobolus ranarum TaxID=34480 RepID=A0ABR2X282_9FUNG
MDHSYISPDLPIYSNLQKPLPSSPKQSPSTHPTYPFSPETRQSTANNTTTQPYYIPIPSSNEAYSRSSNENRTSSSLTDSISEPPSLYSLHNFSPVLASPLSATTTPFDRFQNPAYGSSTSRVQRSRSKRYQSVADPSLKLRSAFRKTSSNFEFSPARILQGYSYPSKSSVLKALTTNVARTYHHCNPAFAYELTRNPRRVLTKPSKGVRNNGCDNENNDYILYVNDILGDEAGHQYLVLEILGAGTFGQVAKCLNTKTNELVGVKVVKNKQAYFQQSMMEVKILEWLNEKFDPEDKRHLLRLLGTFIHRRHLCLVFELLSVNLYELIKQNQFRGLSTNLVRVFISQILDALCVLKEAKIIHCDLKPENILLKSLESATIKVIDFGSACHEQETVYTYIQSRFYRSPEILIGLPYTTSIDMWSLGCIAVELYLGLPLFPGSSEYNQMSRIVEMLGTPPSYMIEVGKNGFEFFERVLGLDNQKQYHLKSMEQYSKEHNCNEKPSKRYFSATSLLELVRTYPLPRKSMLEAEVEKETKSREMFLDFIQGLLNLNPLERWSPHQAKLHPFITGAKYTGHFIPPTMRVFQDSSGGPTSTQTASSILRSVPSPGEDRELSQLQNSTSPQESEIIPNQIRPKIQPHYQPSLSIQNQNQESSLGQYQSQIPGLNLAPDQTVGTQNSATPFFKQSLRTGRSRANTVSGAHVSGDVPIQLQRYAVMSSVNCNTPSANYDPEIIVTVENENRIEEDRQKATLEPTTSDKLTSISTTDQSQSLESKSKHTEVSSPRSLNNIQYPSPNSNINNQPLPIRPTYSAIPKFQDSFPISPTAQASQPKHRSSLNLVARLGVDKPNAQGIHPSTGLSTSPQDGLGIQMSNCAISKPPRSTNVTSLPNSYEEKSSYLQSPLTKASYSYTHYNPHDGLKIDTKFNKDPKQPSYTRARFEPVSPYSDNPLPTISQSYFPSESSLPRDHRVQSGHKASPVDIQPTQSTPYAYSNTTSGLGLYGVSQSNPSEAQNSSSYRMVGNNIPPTAANPRRSHQPAATGYNSHSSPNPKSFMSESRPPHPPIKTTNINQYGSLGNPHTTSYTSQHHTNPLESSPRMNSVLISPHINHNNSSGHHRDLKSHPPNSSDYPRRTYQEYPLQEVMSEEPMSTNPKFTDHQDIGYRGGNLPNTAYNSHHSPRDQKPVNYLMNPPMYETSPKQYQTPGHVPTTHTSSPLVNVTSVSYGDQSYVSPYQESMTAQSSHNQQLPTINSNVRQPPRQPPVHLQSIFVTNNEEPSEFKKRENRYGTVSEASDIPFGFDPEYGHSNDVGITTPIGLYMEESLPTSTPTHTNTSHRKQWFDVKSYFGHNNRTKQKEKSLDLLPVAFSSTATVTTTTTNTESSTTSLITNPNTTVNSIVTTNPQFPLETTTSTSGNFPQVSPQFRTPNFPPPHFSNLNSPKNLSATSNHEPSQYHTYEPNLIGNMRKFPISIPPPVPVSAQVSTSNSTLTSISSPIYRGNPHFYLERNGSNFENVTRDSSKNSKHPSNSNNSNSSTIGIMVDYLPK